MGKKTFLVIWQRMANSGYFKVDAASAEEAIELVGYSTKYCKLTAVQIVGDLVEVGQIG